MRKYELVDAFIDQWAGEEFSRNDLAAFAGITPDEASRLLQQHRIRQLREMRTGGENE